MQTGSKKNNRRIAALVMLLLLVLLAAGVAACGSDTGAAGDGAGAATTAASPETAAAVDTSAAPVTTAAPAEPQPLMVAAAASLKAAFEEIGPAFDAANNVVTTFTFDASGALQTQIEGGAPVDLFASAAWKQVNNLLDKGLVDEASTTVFASNELVLGVPAGSTLAIASFEDLTRDDVKKITTADPESAPQGKAAMEILTSLGILDTVQPKLIYSKNASQTLTYVEEGEVDVGIMYKTDAVAGGDAVEVVATSEPAWHGEIAYVLATVTDSEAKTLAQSFVDFVCGPEGQAILGKYGFVPPPAS